MKAKVTLMMDNIEKTMGRVKYDFFYRSKVTEVSEYPTGGTDIFLSPKVDLLCLEHFDLSRIRSFCCRKSNTILILDHCVLPQTMKFDYGHIEIISPEWKNSSNTVTAHSVEDMEIDRTEQTASEVRWYFSGKNFSYLNGKSHNQFYINAQNVCFQNSVINFPTSSILTTDILTLKETWIHDYIGNTLKANNIVMDKESIILSSNEITLKNAIYNYPITIGDEHGDKLEAKRRLISVWKTIAHKADIENQRYQNALFQNLEETAALKKQSYQEKIKEIDEKLQRDKRDIQKTLEKRMIKSAVSCKKP